MEPLLPPVEVLVLHLPPHTVPVPDIVLDKHTPSHTHQLHLVKTARVKIEQDLGEERLKMIVQELADHIPLHLTRLAVLLTCAGNSAPLHTD